MSLALRLKGVRKEYGKNIALDGLDLEVPRGSVFGFVGPNGAGKTTTFGIVSGAIRPDAGTIDILGKGAFNPAHHAGRVAVLPQDCQLNPFSSARQILTFFARLQGYSKRDGTREAERVLELVQLQDRGDARVRELSHGMKRRLAVAQAFLGDPELVLLDEPTGGLDPHLVVEMRNVLRQQAKQRTVVVSTHILGDIQSTCDHVAFLDAGRCVRSASMTDLTRKQSVVCVRLAEPVAIDELAVLTGRSPTLRDLELRYTLLPDEDPTEVQPQILADLLKHGARVLEVQLGESLEAAYMELRDEAVAERRAEGDVEVQQDSKTATPIETG